MALPLCRTALNRQSSFGFTCNRCLHCCRDKKIQLNPYEVARLAANRGLSTTEFIARHTNGGGTVLGTQADGTCTFLGPAGCTVHADRPLVCRLYPLGRYVDFSGTETFAQIEQDEHCRGILREDGPIDDYLADQGAAAFMHAADRYLELLWKLLAIIQERDLASAETNAVVAAVRSIAGGEAETPVVPWIDMDPVVAGYCDRQVIPVPGDIQAKMALHIEAVLAWAA
ncbi:MAG: YkgJ family cysteine cluster protein [Betaproteobacteria bacterium]